MTESLFAGLKAIDCCSWIAGRRPIAAHHVLLHQKRRTRGCHRTRLRAHAHTEAVWEFSEETFTTQWESSAGLGVVSP